MFYSHLNGASRSYSCSGGRVQYQESCGLRLGLTAKEMMGHGECQSCMKETRRLGVFEINVENLLNILLRSGSTYSVIVRLWIWSSLICVLCLGPTNSVFVKSAMENMKADQIVQSQVATNVWENGFDQVTFWFLVFLTQHNSFDITEKIISVFSFYITVFSFIVPV